MLTLEQFKAARATLRGVIRTTSLIHSPALSRACGNQVYLKPENMQVTGAYKIRGAYYKISTLSEEEKSRGLITASAGNHAQGLGLCRPGGGGARHHRDAHYHPSGKGKQHQGLWRPGYPSWRSF